MAVIIEWSVKGIDEVSGHEPMAAMWMEPVQLKYRKKRAWLVLSIGVILSVALAMMQFNSGRPLEDFWLSVIPVAVGLLRWRIWLSREFIRKYASTTRLLSKKERFRKTAWPILGFLVGAYLLMLGFIIGRDAGFMILGVFIIICSISTGLVQYSRKEEVILTKEGAEAKVSLEMGGVFIDESATKVFSHWWMRYPFAGILLYVAYLCYLDYRLGSAFAAFMIVVAATAVVGFIWWAIFGAVAALPVSVAVIIGAVIIAGAVSSK